MITDYLFYSENHYSNNMEPILKAHFNSFKSQFEIITDGDIQKESKAFEKFVNYVLFSSDYPEIFTANIELLDFISVGGGQDTGIDGIGIKVNDRLVRSIDEVKDLTHTSKKINVEFVFIQSKMRPNFDVKELQTFATGVKVFFSEGFLPENDRISELRTIKDFIYSDEKVISKLEANPSLYLHYVGAGTEPTDEHFQGVLKLLNKELSENFYFEDVTINIVSGKHLIKLYRELENKFDVQLNIMDIFPLIVTSHADVKKAYTFTCKANEFLKILQKEDKSLRRSLFNDNVRDYLGNRSAINNEIEKTIAETPEMFLLCNNGVTIVCSDFEQVRDKLVKIENPQIVNGCQTSNSIYNLKDNPNIEKLQLLIRLISTDNYDVTNKIVRGTNKQNQVLDEAFEATRPFHQEVLEPFFLSFDEGVKIFYERRTKQYNYDPFIKKTHIVNLRILTQVFVGMFLDAPHESHRHEAKLLEKYANDKEDRKIFREDHSPYPYYICALTWYMFEKYFREEIIPKKYVTYKAHLYLIYRYSLGEFPPKFINKKSLDSYCTKMLNHLEEENFKVEIHNVLKVFDKIQKKWNESKSRFGIKDNKEFTDLLVKLSREHFIQSQDPVIKEETYRHKGKILRVTWRHGVWFGFIKRGIQYDNIYFDSRAYNGELRDLIPGTEVEFELGKRLKGEFARNVRIV